MVEATIEDLAITEIGMLTNISVMLREKDSF
jgi:hypothetical protein